MKSQIQYVHAVTHARFGLANERARALALMRSCGFWVRFIRRKRKFNLSMPNEWGISLIFLCVFVC